MFIPIHALAASLVILIGPISIFRKRKDSKHKFLGRTWVVAMYLVCVSGMFIYSLTGGFTIFHALAIFTFFTTTLGVTNIRRKNVKAHLRCMIGSYLGAIIAGGFAVGVPSRWIPTFAVSNPVVFWTVVAVVIVATTAWVTFVLRSPRTSAHA